MAFETTTSGGSRTASNNSNCPEIALIVEQDDDTDEQSAISATKKCRHCVTCLERSRCDDEEDNNDNYDYNTSSSSRRIRRKLCLESSSQPNLIPPPPPLVAHSSRRLKQARLEASQSLLILLKQRLASPEPLPNLFPLDHSVAIPNKGKEEEKDQQAYLRIAYQKRVRDMERLVQEMETSILWSDDDDDEDDEDDYDTSNSDEIILPLEILQAVGNEDFSKIQKWLGPLPIPPERLNAKSSSQAGNSSLLHVTAAAAATATTTTTTTTTKTTTTTTALEFLEWLLQCGANVDIEDCFGMTPLCHACRSADPSAALILLQWGANTSTFPPPIESYYYDYDHHDDDSYYSLLDDDVSSLPKTTNGNDDKDDNENENNNKNDGGRRPNMIQSLLQTPLGGRRCEIVGLFHKNGTAADTTTITSNKWNGKIGIVGQYHAESDEYTVAIEDDEEEESSSSNNKNKETKILQIQSIHLKRKDRVPFMNKYNQSIGIATEDDKETVVEEEEERPRKAASVRTEQFPLTTRV
eukprot:scaffold1685_cov91-Cylindrotheca_fusiformis.AAC.1